jgi:hypothetical protein
MVLLVLAALVGMFARCVYVVLCVRRVCLDGSSYAVVFGVVPRSTLQGYAYGDSSHSIVVIDTIKLP